MDKKPLATKWALFAVVLLIGALGFSAASFISEANIYIARGALDIAFIYLLSREIDRISKNEPLEVLCKFPSNVKHFVWILGLAIFFYWALSEMLQFLFWIIRSLSSLSGLR